MKRVLGKVTANRGRFTAWFGPIERTALDQMAEDMGATANYVLRKALRQYVGKDRLKEAAERVSHVTGNTE